MTDTVETTEKEETAAAYFRSAIAGGEAAVLLSDLAKYDGVLRELGIQESHKHPVTAIEKLHRNIEIAERQNAKLHDELQVAKAQAATNDALREQTRSLRKAMDEMDTTLLIAAPNHDLVAVLRAIIRDALWPSPVLPKDLENGEKT